MFKTKYRIVEDRYNGYESQRKLWWFPVWIQWPGVNSSFSIEQAVDKLKRHLKSGNVVKELTIEDIRIF